MAKKLTETQARAGILAIVVIFSVFTISASMLLKPVIDWREWLSNFLYNVGITGTSIVVFFMIFQRPIETLNEIVQERSERQREIEALVSKIRNSKDNSISLEAVRMLRDLGADKDGSLRNRQVEESGRDNSLHWTKLQHADLAEFDLSGTDLGGSDLHNATLWYANLQEASLGRANLQHANLGGTDLRGTDLTEAKLYDAKTNPEPKLDETTVLPNGQKWTQGFDIAAYIASLDPSQ